MLRVHVLRLGVGDALLVITPEAGATGTSKPVYPGKIRRLVASVAVPSS